MATMMTRVIGIGVEQRNVIAVFGDGVGRRVNQRWNRVRGAMIVLGLRLAR